LSRYSNFLSLWALYYVYSFIAASL
jgi:hypothetical protein